MKLLFSRIIFFFGAVLYVMNETRLLFNSKIILFTIETNEFKNKSSMVKYYKLLYICVYI